MKKTLTEAVQQQVLQLDNVAAVSKKHIFLKDGRVVVPDEFEVCSKDVLLVWKLSCCECRVFKHKPGQLVSVASKRVLYASGRDELIEKFPPFCDSENWWLEEVFEDVKLHKS